MDLKEKLGGVFDKDGDGKADILEKAEEKFNELKQDKDGDGKIDVLENIEDKAENLGDKIGGLFKKD